MKNLRKMWLAALAALCIAATAGAVAGCKGEEPTAKLPDDVGGVVITVEGSSPADSLGTAGDVCLCAESGKLYRKTAQGWVEAAYESCNVGETSLTVTYQDGSVGTYALTSEGETHDCAHENLASVEPVAIYEAKCVIPGIGVKTCPVCHESFPVILPATGVHTYEEGGYSCTVCGETDYFRNGKVDGSGRFVIEDMRDVPITDGTLEIPGEIDGHEVVIGAEAFGSDSHGQNETLRSVVIGEGVKEIQGHAFHNCKELESVVLPESLTVLGASNDGIMTTNYRSIFEGCTSLKSVTFEGNITVIGNRTFYGCSSLSQIDLPDSLEAIGQEAFNGAGLTQVEIPAGVRRIDSMAFNRCANLTAVHFKGDLLTEISSSLFKSCTNLSEIEIPANVTKIGSSAFESCMALTQITIPAEVTLIDNYVFRYSANLGSVNFAEGSKLLEIGMNAFYCGGNNAKPNEALRELVLPEGLKKIGSSAFGYCTALESVVLPEGLEKIGSSAFGHCTALESVVLPEGLEQIGSSAFGYCTALKSVVLPASISEFGDKGGVSSSGSVFYKCSSLKLFYCGTLENWNQTVQDAETLASAYQANLAFYSADPPAEEGSYWYYKDGAPTLW